MAVIFLLLSVANWTFNWDMPRQIPRKIKDNFADYSRFLSQSKTTEHNRIKMVRGGPRKNLMGRTSVMYASISGDKALEAEISVEDQRCYHFRLFAFWFDEGPCFRFDSKGRGHCNPENGQGLRKRQILAPHFHKFDEKENVEIAYPYTYIRGEDSLSVADYNIGLEHFCQEARLSCNPTGSPVLEIIQGELALSSEDPQNGVSF
jgi:hypothetical protein